MQVEDFERATGWALKPEGACRGPVCVPLPRSGTITLEMLGQRLGMGIVHDEGPGLWALGPLTVSGRALEKQVLVEHEKYVAAVRDWARHGSASRYVLPPEEVLMRSRPRARAESEAAAHFELGIHLQRLGHDADAYYPPLDM